MTTQMAEPGCLPIGRRLQWLLKCTVRTKGSAELGGEGSSFSAMGTEQNRSRSVSEGGEDNKSNGEAK